MKKLSAVLASFVFMGCASNATHEAPPGADRWPASEAQTMLPVLHGTVGTINPPGFDRKPANIVLPVQYAEKDKWPLVILMHGIGGNAQATDYWLTLRFRTSLKGFILVTPEGTVTPDGVKDWAGKQFWNATDFCCDFGKIGVNDVDYISKLIDTVQKDYHVDADRIYLIGHSNGGFMANRLGCEIGDRLAGIASIAGGGFKNPADCKNPRPVSYLQIHAVNDPTVSYKDVPLYAGGQAVVAQWLKKDGCMDPGTDGPKKDDIFLIPGPDTTPHAWTCAQGTHVAFWTIDAATIPNHSPHVPLFNLNFSDEVLDFLFHQKRVSP